MDTQKEHEAFYQVKLGKAECANNTSPLFRPPMILSNQKKKKKKTEIIPK